MVKTSLLCLVYKANFAVDLSFTVLTVGFSVVDGSVCVQGVYTRKTHTWK
jgi:hypothetical protein